MMGSQHCLETAQSPSELVKGLVSVLAQICLHETPAADYPKQKGSEGRRRFPPTPSPAPLSLRPVFRAAQHESKDIARAGAQHDCATERGVRIDRRGFASMWNVCRTRGARQMRRSILSLGLLVVLGISCV